MDVFIGIVANTTPHGPIEGRIGTNRIETKNGHSQLSLDRLVELLSAHDPKNSQTFEEQNENQRITGSCKNSFSQIDFILISRHLEGVTRTMTCENCHE